MIGETISHYKIVEKLGQGGMGVVYKAEDLTLDRVVALKFLAPHLVSDEDSHKRFVREAKAAATIDHPHICTVHEIAETGGRTFIVMAYVEGQSLEQLVATETFNIDEALEFVVQVAEALSAAHEKGVVHRDIKPGNILIANRRSGNARQTKLVDFGLAQFAGSSKITKLNSTVGTIAYMSPEQTAGRDVDHRADIWGLGVLLYRLVTGQLPFKGHYDAAVLYSIMNDDPAALSDLCSGVSPELDQIAGKALAKDPDDRYERMDDMLADLRAQQRSGVRHEPGVRKVPVTKWARVQEVFIEVCDLEPAARPQRLKELCGGDQELLREVDRWLQHDSPESIIDSRVSGMGQAVGKNEPDSWNGTEDVPDPYLGRTVQNYRLLEIVGKGGMGQVYRAEDIRLKRPVAVKFLSPRFLRDERQRKRFLREAQTAAALDHPSICQVYDVGEIEGHPYIVTAFIDGDNLAEAIPDGGLSAGTAIDYAIQIAEGLQAAHRVGITHRDMKPGNVILAGDADGELRAKIIDFGLARIRDGSKLTEVGTLIGTAVYIAPEVLQGHAADERGDIWSLGVMLYEMFCGHPPFDAENRQRLFYMICHEEANPLTALCPDLPEDVGRTVMKALEKDRERRYQSVRDLLKDLRDLKRQVSSQGIALSDQDRAVAARPRTFLPPAAESPTAPANADTAKKILRWMALGAAGAGVIVAAVIGFAWLPVSNDVQATPEVTRLTFDSALSLHPAVSPDGKYVAFASDRSGEANLDIWVQTLPGGEPVRLTKDIADEDFPSFSADGTKIAFQSKRDEHGIYSIPLVGGEPRLLAERGNRPRYSPDGQRLSFSLQTAPGNQALTNAVFLMPPEGGEPAEFRTGFPTSSNPIWSPDGSQLLYAGFPYPQAESQAGFQLDGAARGGAAWYITPVSGGNPVPVEPSAQFSSFLAGIPIPLAWLADNRILFLSGSNSAINLWLATLSPDNRRIVGPPEQLTFGAARITEASIAGSGAVVFDNTAARSRLWNIPFDGETKEGGVPEVVTNRDFTYWPSLSDTGKLTYLSQIPDKLNLWLRDLSSGKETLLTSVEGHLHLVSALINRDGTQIAYGTIREGKPAIYTVGAGGGTSQQICENCGQLRAWSPDGTVMLSQEGVYEGSKWVGERIMRIDAASGRQTVLFDNGQFLYSPDFSPDGAWVAFQARTHLADRREQLLVAPMSDAAQVESDRWVPITELKYFDANPLFSRDGRLIYFNSDRDGFTCLWAVRLSPATKKPVADPFAVKHFHGSPRYYSRYPQFTVGQDRIIISLEQVQSDLWMTKLPE